MKVTLNTPNRKPPSKTQPYIKKYVAQMKLLHSNHLLRY